MFLTRVEIENIRSIEHLDLSTASTDGPRQWTLILGQNGTGKSTILRAVALALAGSDALVELVGDADDWIRRGKRTGRIKVEMVTAEGDERSAELVIRRSTKLGLFQDNRETLQALDAAIGHSPRNYFTTGYGVSRRPEGNLRRSIRGRETFRSLRAKSVATLFSPDETLTPLEVWAMDLDYRHKGGFQTVRRILNTLLPGVDLVRIDRQKRELVFETPDGKLPFRLLSDGYQNAASWVADLLAHLTDVFNDYKNPLGARGLLLIDEVDLHLHPVWQRELQRFITSTLSNFQVVCTTHSPLTAHQTSEDELYFLERPTSGPSTLEAYDGAANRLMLHQLIASPIFGFETVDSDEVERKRREYRQLRQKGKGRTPTEQRRFKGLAAEISELPEWGDTSPVQQSVANALAKIERNLAK